MAGQQILAHESGVKPFNLDGKATSRGLIGFEIAGKREDLREHAVHFALDGLADLLELGLIEAGRMARRAQGPKAQDAAVRIDGASTVREGFSALSGASAAGEIADVLVVLRKRALEFDLKFLGYLLEMAYIEAFEQSQKSDL